MLSTSDFVIETFDRSPIGKVRAVNIGCLDGCILGTYQLTNLCRLAIAQDPFAQTCLGISSMQNGKTKSGIITIGDTFQSKGMMSRFSPHQFTTAKLAKLV